MAHVALHPGSNGHIPLPRQAALDLIKRDIMPLPVPYGTKNPSDRKGWQNERYTSADLSAFNVDKLNVGMRLGHITAADGTVLTNKFVDVDLDCPEAVRAARYCLPPTGMMWGRSSNPRSHYGYRLKSLEGAHSVGNLNDPLNPRDAKGKADARICEIRWNGQTLAPGSVNTEGDVPEQVRWEPDGDGDPTEIEFATLEWHVHYMASIALLARYWVPGIRHDATLPLAGLLQRGGMTEDRALQFVEALCKTAGESDADLTNRLGCVRDTYARASANLPTTGGPTLEDYIDKRVVNAVRRWLDLKRPGNAGNIAPDGIAMTDIGNAERFVRFAEGRALYCDDQSQWYIYEGGLWSPDRRNQVQLWMKEIARSVYASIMLPGVGWDTLPSDVRKYLKSLNGRGGISAALDLARGDLAVLPEQFDADPWLLNCKNGTVELHRDGTHYVRAFRWQDLLTKQWNAPYDPDAVHEDLEWYRRTFVPEDDRWDFLEEALGYSLTGLPKRFNFQFLGPSHAGKSMLLRLIKVHAGGYGASLKYSALKPDYHGGGDKPRSDLLGLRGARLLTVAEVDGGTVWDTTLFKTMLSGGDAFSIRGAYEKRGQTFSFTVSLWTSGNDAYGADTSDDAAYERVHVIKFEHPMPEGNRDDAREDEIVDPDRTGAAFLAAALRGFTRLYGEKGGRLVPPDTIRQATQELREELDPFGPIFEELAIATGDLNDGVLKSELSTAAKAVWQRDRQHTRWGYKVQNRFEDTVERRGGVVKKSSARFNNGQYWQGIRWTSEAVAFHSVTLPDWKRGDGDPSE